MTRTAASWSRSLFRALAQSFLVVLVTAGFLQNAAAAQLFGVPTYVYNIRVGVCVERTRGLSEGRNTPEKCRKQTRHERGD